ncbi:hypothetical protein PFISCL1PPCAC_18635 [Pristionchus fissidentatus]|uniref:Uncharacterized protein n=1 Tax=Pristionchus fissidentatus TaxID=1538716 RepID=A0AAV5W9E8_9BILA|nr:hypothetical protein PFISCL1PPCAC_18635 [Pristionchus fissidentatus]
MLSRVKESTARTPTDIRIYAEKAAYEGQALRSMINGLQTRTKGRLSPETGQFAERCYEERLLFYVCEALRVCLVHQAGREKASEILQQLESCGTEEERDLRAIWSPLFECCADSLRAVKLESSQIRLSKLSELWKKRTGTCGLGWMLSCIVLHTIHGNHRAKQLCHKEILRVIALPKNTHFAFRDSRIESFSTLLPTSDPTALFLENAHVSIVTDSLEQVEVHVLAYLAQFVMNHSSTLHIILESQADAESFFANANLINLKCDTFLNESKSIQSGTACFIVTSLEYIRQNHTNCNFESAMFIQDGFNALAYDERRNHDCQISEFLTDLYIWGTVILHHLREIEANISEIATPDSLATYINSWPNAVGQVINYNDLWKCIATYHSSEKNYSQRIEIKEALIEYAKKALWERPYTVAEEQFEFIQANLFRFVESFFASRQLELGRDYAVVIDPIDRNPRIVVQLFDSVLHYLGTVQFLELRHGLKPTPFNSEIVDPRRMIISSLRSFHVVVNTAMIELQQSSLQNRANTKIKGKQSRDENQTTNRTSLNEQTLSDLVQEKRRLAKSISKWTVWVQVIHAEREPIGEIREKPFDFRCDGFAESMRSNIQEARLKLQNIDKELDTRDLSRYTNLDIKVLKKIAYENDLSVYSLRSIVNVVNPLPPMSFADLQLALEQSIAGSLSATQRWTDHINAKCIGKQRCFFVLSPDGVSDATNYLPHLRQVELPEDYIRTHFQLSDRCLDDCTFYEETSKDLDRDALLKISGVTEEFFAKVDDEWILNLKATDNLFIRVMAKSAKKGKHLFLYPQRVFKRMARDLVENGFLFCHDMRKIRDGKTFYEDLILPCIYNPMLSPEDYRKRDAREALINVQSALMAYGSFEWMEWLARRIDLSSFDDMQILSFYHKCTAEREACLRDETLISRIKEAFAQSNQEMSTEMDAIHMDAFINNIVETINRGDRLIEIKAPFKDEETVEKLARFIRSRRTPPIRS